MNEELLNGAGGPADNTLITTQSQSKKMYFTADMKHCHGSKSTGVSNNINDGDFLL